MADENKRSPTGVSEVIGMANTGKKVPVLALIKDDVSLAAMASKALSAVDKVSYTADGTRKITTPDVGRLNTIANRTARNISEARTTIQMLPDQEHAQKIRIGATLSPKDLMTVELIYSAPAGILPSALVSHATNAIGLHIEKIYKIKKKLPRMLREIMFEKGSHIVTVLAENAIDELINRHNAVSMESIHQVLGEIQYGKSLGFLGKSDTVVNGTTPQPHRVRSTPLGEYGFISSLESIDELKNAYGTPNFAGIDSSAADDAKLRLNFAGHGDGPAIDPKTKKPAATNTPPPIDAFMIDNIVFSDNPNILRAPLIEDKLRRDHVNSKLGLNRRELTVSVEGYGTEEGTSVKTINDRKLEQLLQKPRKNAFRQMEVMKTQSQLTRTTIGSPLIMELPPESVIPVYKPGQEERHVGYFVLLDQTGAPVRLENYRDVYADMSNRFNFTESSQSSTVIDRLKQLTNGFQCTDQNHLDNTARIYGDMIEQDVAARFRNSIHSNGVKIARNNDYYLLMLHRMLSQQRTTILFLPVETTEYFAMKYDENGVGVSYMDDMKILNNMQAIVIFANTMAALKNSIARTEVNMTIDEDDPDPQKTIDTLMDILMRNNQSAFPLGIDSPADLVNYLSRAQYKFNIDGHPGLPQHKLEFNETVTNYQKVDTELSEDLQKRRMMAMGLSPETASNGWNGESATEIVSNNLMLSKSAMTDQEILNPQITSLVRKILRVDEPIIEELRDIIDSGYDQLSIDEEEIAKELGIGKKDLVRGIVVSHKLNKLLEEIEVTLPRPNTTSERSQLEAMKTHEELVDAAIESYISSAFMTDNVGGEVSRIVDDIQKNIKAMLMRQFMAEHGILPELGQLMSADEMDDESKSLWEQNQDFAKTLMRLLGDYTIKLKKAKDESDKIAQAVGDTSDSGGTMGDFTNDSSGNDNPLSGDPTNDSLGFDDPLPPEDDPLPGLSVDAPGAPTEGGNPPAISTDAV